jgi:hypothetical protein
MQRLWRADTLTCDGTHETPDQSHEPEQ